MPRPGQGGRPIRRLPAVLSAAPALAALLAATLPATGQEYGGGSEPIDNPCLDERAEKLKCPDLRVAKPAELYLHDTGRKRLLHATNNIRSRGLGPLEVRGKRSGRRTMRAHQVIYRRGGGLLHRPATSTLVFYNIPGQGPYWKYHEAVRFELWSIAADGGLGKRLRVGPKLNYCFRDLKRTKPSRRSPKRAVYPACSQNRRAKRRRLGTSVGWSDIYPSSYHENWINTKGLRGCMWLVHRADPDGYLAELNEKNNVARRRIKLRRRGERIRSC